METILKPRNSKINEKPQEIQKKGQSEFVEFVDPLNAKKLQNKEFMEKRLAASNNDGPARFSTTNRALKIFSGFGNVAFMGKQVFYIHLIIF